MLPTKLPSRLRTMPFSVSLQERTTLSPLNFLRLAPSVDMVLICEASIPSAWRHAIGLQRAHPEFAEVLNKSARHVGTFALFSLLSPAWKQQFLVPSMALTLRMHLTKSHNKKKKVAAGLLLDKLHKQYFAGPLPCRASRVLEPISRFRIADILHHMKRVSCASRLGFFHWFLSHLVMGRVLHGDFTPLRTITPAVLDAQMNLTL